MNDSRPPSADPRRVTTGVPACYEREGRRNWHQRRSNRAIVSLLSGVQGSVLDYGCGYGDITFEISKRNPVQGVDVDPARVAFASREYAPIRFQVCRPDGLDFDDESFDVVVSSAVIHFVPDPLRYLEEARRVLRDRGHLLIVCSNVMIMLNTMRRLLGRPQKPPPMRIMYRSEVADMLEHSGFEIVRETFFYDPPFISWKNPGDVLIGTINQTLSLLRVRATCGYFLLLARKHAIVPQDSTTDSVPAQGRDRLA